MMAPVRAETENMMQLLPNNLARLADIADAKGNNRYAVNSVHLKLIGGGEFLAEATDTKTAIRVYGKYGTDEIDEYPELPGIKAAQNGGTDALIPTATWRKTFMAAAKMNRRTTKPILRSVATVIGKDTATLAMTDLEAYPVETTRLVDGKFPPIDQFFPKKQHRVAAFAVDAQRFAQMLETINDLAPADSENKVEIELFKNGGSCMVKVAASTATGITADGLLIPLGDITCTRAKGDKNELDELNDTIKGLEQSRDDLIKERDQFRDSFAEMTAAYDAMKAARDALMIDASAKPELAEMTAQIDAINQRLVDTAILANRIEQVNLANDNGQPAKPMTRAERIAAMKAGAA